MLQTDTDLAFKSPATVQKKQKHNQMEPNTQQGVKVYAAAAANNDDDADCIGVHSCRSAEAAKYKMTKMTTLPNISK